MHELGITHEILEIVLRYARRHRVTQVSKVLLEIGELSDLEQEWIQHYFDAISRGSVAEGAIIEVKKLPCRFFCRQCGNEFVTTLTNDEPLVCYGCGSEAVEMISGSEYTVKSMEAT